jgi:hypothetical protein
LTGLYGVKLKQFILFVFTLSCFLPAKKTHAQDYLEVPDPNVRMIRYIMDSLGSLSQTVGGPTFTESIAKGYTIIAEIPKQGQAFTRIRQAAGASTAPVRALFASGVTASYWLVYSAGQYKVVAISGAKVVGVVAIKGAVLAAVFAAVTVTFTNVFMAMDRHLNDGKFYDWAGQKLYELNDRPPKWMYSLSDWLEKYVVHVD